ncbi:helix-turn-helix domain-containing protein [Rhodoferax antarcticus]|uniref:helix-turn-helix domain-containing protein n=1 Tax=Rhodoferax antarcticus TaxID=81479 RepID=UPI0009FA6E17
MSFGKLIRSSREKKGIDLKVLASAIGISSAYWSRIEREKELSWVLTVVQHVNQVR